MAVATAVPTTVVAGQQPMTVATAAPIAVVASAAVATVAGAAAGGARDAVDATHLDSRAPAFFSSFFSTVEPFEPFVTFASYLLERVLCTLLLLLDLLLHLDTALTFTITCSYFQ